MSPILARDLDHDVWRADHHLENADDRQLVSQAKRADRYAGMTRWAKDDHTFQPARALPRRVNDAARRVSDTAQFMRLVADYYAADTQADEIPPGLVDRLIQAVQVEVFDLREAMGLDRKDGAA